MHGPLLPVLGYARNFDQKEYAQALAETKKIAMELDKHLKHQEESNNMQWIVYDKISLADVYIGTCFITCFQTIFDAGVRNAIPYLTKWFDRFSKHHAIIETFGLIKMCQKAIKPSAAVGPPAAAGAKKEQPKKKDDDLEMDLFGDDNEDDKEAAKKATESAKKNNAKK